MSSPAKLTDTQRAILFEASQRKDRCLIAPKTLKGAATQKVAAKLLKAGLVSEIKARSGMEIWRRDEETGQAYSLKLTVAAHWPNGAPSRLKFRLRVGVLRHAQTTCRYSDKAMRRASSAASRQPRGSTSWRR